MTEKSIREIVTRLDQVIDLFPNLIFVKDIEGRYVFVNKAFADGYSTTIDQIVGKKELEINPNKELAEKYLKDDLEVITTGKIKVIPEEQFIDFNGNIRYVQTTKIPFSLLNPNEKGILGIATDITSRKHAKDAMWQSETKYHLLFKHIPFCFSLQEVITDKNNNPVDYRFLEANEYIKDFTGLSPENLMGKTLLEIQPDADIEMIKKYCMVGLTGNPFELEYYSKTNKRYIRVVAYSPAKGQFATIFEDITNQKKAEQVYQKSESRLRQIIDLVPHFIFAKNIQGKFVLANNAVAKIYGTTPREIIGKTDADLNPDKKEVEHFVEDDLLVIKKRVMKEIPIEKITDAEGHLNYLHTIKIPFTLSDSEEKAVLGVSTNITERINIENALKISEEKYRMIIDVAVDGIIIGDPKGNIISVNQQTCKLTGYARKELIDKNITCFFSEYELNKHPLRYDLLEQGNIVRFERNITRKDGISLPIEMSSKKMPDGTYQAFIRDISEIKETEALKRKIAETELKNKVKSQFMANLSHEIRNPLNAIIGLSNLISKENLKEEDKEYIQAIQASSLHLMNILNDILDYSKIEADKIELKKTDFNLRQLIEEFPAIYKNKANEKGLSFFYQFIGDIPEEVNTDSNKLKQILINLLDNAIKFTEKGEISIHIKLIEKLKNKVFIKFTVKDTGIGIHEKNFDKVFQSFTQLDSSTKKAYTGTGLGLSICKNYVELLNGEIGFESVVNKGSAFFFFIPLDLVKNNHTRKNKFSEKTKESQVNKNTSTHKHILLAEDDALNRLYLNNFLESHGFSVDTANNGFDVLKKFNQEHYDVILMDCQMPKMDGFEASQKIREIENKNQLDHTEIIALTGYGLNDISEQYQQAQMDDYIVKPINESELLNKIAKSTQKKYL